jgi:hypothetical protein
MSSYPSGSACAARSPLAAQALRAARRRARAGGPPGQHAARQRSQLRPRRVRGGAPRIFQRGVLWGQQLLVWRTAPARVPKGGVGGPLRGLERARGRLQLGAASSIGIGFARRVHLSPRPAVVVKRHCKARNGQGAPQEDKDKAIKMQEDGCGWRSGREGGTQRGKEGKKPQPACGAPDGASAAGRCEDGHAVGSPCVAPHCCSE